MILKNTNFVRFRKNYYYYMALLKFVGLQKFSQNLVKISQKLITN